VAAVMVWVVQCHGWEVRCVAVGRVRWVERICGGRGTDGHVGFVVPSLAGKQREHDFTSFLISSSLISI
jgi:hypothetical protein